MSNYFEEMYEYLVKPENYKAAKEIAELIPSIERQLVSDFWKTVKDNLQNDFEFIGWKLKTEVDKEGDKYLFSKPHWNDIAIGFETNYFSMFEYGIVFDRIKFDPSKIDEISEKNNDKLTTLYPDSKGWLCYKSFLNVEDFKFNGSKEKFLRILPASRETMSLEISSLIQTYAKNVETICDEINNDCRKVVI